MNRIVKPAARLAALSAVIALVACTTTYEGDKVDYKSAGKAPSLEIPPDLSQLSQQSRYAIPGKPVTASSLNASQPTSGKVQSVGIVAQGDVKIERVGNKRWLVVKRPAAQLWNPVREFWQESGFLLTIDQPNLGIMETDWAENRAKLPQDVIRATVGKLLDSVYSTGEMDKFRTRMETGPDGATEIFISHRGMIEQYNNKDNTSTIWTNREVDSELEAEFLKRLMVKLGTSQEQAQALIASSVSREKVARVTTINGVPVMQLDDNFDQAWRRVGLALDRTGFSVEDRDRSQGVYFVRYVEPGVSKEPGWLGKLFGAKPQENAPLKFRIAVRGTGDVTTVSILDATGQPDSSDNAKRIVQVLADDIR